MAQYNRKQNVENERKQILPKDEIRLMTVESLDILGFNRCYNFHQNKASQVRINFYYLQY